MSDALSGGIPLGFGIALTQNVDALTKFTQMTKTEQQQVVKRAKALTTKQEMKSYVNNMFE